MPSGTHLLDTGFPTFTAAESTEEKLARIQNYLFMLLEELRWLLGNLGAENFNPEELQALEQRTAEAAQQLTAKTIVADAVITRELYADYGAIADLTVWRLRTDYLRAQNWLRGSTAQLDYIDIHDEQISFITASTDGSRTVQFERDGYRFWWTDETRTQMTMTEETQWPVYVYTYTELVKLSVRFTTVDGIVQPVVVIGAGDENGRSKGYIHKGQTGLKIFYTQSGGGTKAIELNDDGVFVDGIGFEVVSDYPATERQNVLYIKTGN